MLGHLMLSAVVLACAFISCQATRHLLGLRPRRFKVGGLHHWRIGRIGGSFYIAKARKA